MVKKELRFKRYVLSKYWDKWKNKNYGWVSLIEKYMQGNLAVLCKKQQPDPEIFQSRKGMVL